MAALFPNAPVTALTATATQSDREVIASTLHLKKPRLVVGNLDRANIFFAKIFREDDISASILQPIAESLLEEGTKFPLTILYMPLLWCAKAYKLFEGILKEKQYVPEGCPSIPENRLFGQFHSPQTDQMKEAILTQLCQPDSKCGVVFATMAMGMGVDIPCVREVIHIGPPRSVREYYQEAGRAGRDGQQSRATLYYNNRDIAANKPGMTDNIRSYCKSTGKCLRKQLLYFLDAPPPVPYNILHTCCDVCKSHCSCTDCKHDTVDSETAQNTAAEATTAEVTTAEATVCHDSVSNTIVAKLQAYLASLKSDRKSRQLRSGTCSITTDVLRDIVYKRNDISSVSYLMDNFPIFSKSVAEGIFRIL